jgi:hypothetical protein
VGLGWWGGLEMMVEKLLVSGEEFDAVDAEHVV